MILNEDGKWRGIHNGNKAHVRAKHVAGAFAGVKPDCKAWAVLEGRRKADAAHGASKGKSLHTVPGSLQRGGGR